MLILDKGDVWGSKVNFVDKNNVVLGYDLEQCCCELADWYITKTIPSSSEPEDEVSEEGLEDYVFDTSFIEYPVDSDMYGEWGCVVFKIVAEGKPDLYISLHNTHNGYYGHGFTFKCGQELIEEGGL